MKLHVYDGLWVQKMQLTNLFQFNFTLNNSYLNDGIFIYFKKWMANLRTIAKNNFYFWLQIINSFVSYIIKVRSKG